MDASFGRKDEKFQKRVKPVVPNLFWYIPPLLILELFIPPLLHKCSRVAETTKT